MRKATIGLALLAVLFIAIPAMAQTETDTTEPPPEGGVSAGGGALALLCGATVLAMRRTAGRE